MHIVGIVYMCCAQYKYAAHPYEHIYSNYSMHSNYSDLIRIAYLIELYVVTICNDYKIMSIYVNYAA